jgi:hypothetical protein
MKKKQIPNPELKLVSITDREARNATGGGETTQGDCGCVCIEDEKPTTASKQWFSGSGPVHCCVTV